jgi:chromosome segregation ATPase
MAITKEAVFEAATTIAQAGQKPTTINVRERLGTGSFTTISGLLREWRAGRKTVESVRNEEIPQEIREAGHQLIQTLWMTASSWLSRELATARKVASEQVEEAESQVQEVMAALEVLEKERDELIQTKDELNRRCQALESRCSALEATVTELRTELQNERQHQRTLSEKLATEGARAAALEERGKLEQVRSQQLQAEIEALRTERSELERRCHTVSDRLTIATGKAERAEERAQQFERKVREMEVARSPKAGS